MTETECKICKKVFESDGATTVCRDCMGLTAKTAILFNDTAMVQEITPVAATMKCRTCKAEYPATPEFWYRDRGLKSGYKSECKPCRKKMESAARRKRIEAKGKQKVQRLLSSDELYQRKMAAENKPHCLITIDMSAHSKEYMAIFAYAFSQERTVESQIRWWLRELAAGRSVDMEGAYMWGETDAT